MSGLSKVLIAATVTFAVPVSTAFAQDDAPVVEGEAGVEAGASVDASGDVTVPPVEGEATMTMSAGMGPFTKETYPQALIDRPLTLVKGMLEVRAALAIVKITGADTGIGLGVGAGYGITDQLEIGLATGIQLSPDADWSKRIGLYGKVSVIDSAKFDMAPSVGTTLNFQDGADVFTGIQVGGGVRYLLSDKLFIRAGDNFLDLQVTPDAGARINLNAGVGFQATPQLAVVADLNLISLKLFGDMQADSTFFDPFGVALTGLFAVSNKLDVYAQINFPSVADAGDLLFFNLGANIRL